MAGVSFLHHLTGEDDDRGDSSDSFPYLSQHLDGFDVYTSDLYGRRHLPRQYSSRGFIDNVSGTELFTNTDLFDRGNQVNFVMDLFHQRVEQSSALMERVFGEMDDNRFDVNLDLGLGLPGRREMEPVNLDLELGLGFAGGVDCNVDEIDGVSGFMVADFSDDLSLSRRNDTISSGLRVLDIESDSEDAGGIEEGFEEEVLYDDDDDASLRACWDAFQLADEAYNRGDGNGELEWEEVDVHERESVLEMLYSEAEERRVRELEWEVLLNVHNLENSESGNGVESFDMDFEMFFGQFADIESISIGRPPASRLAVENLLSVCITRDDVEKNNALCAVCKDEMNVGQMAKQLPCVHRYHGECIVPWLGIRNTCPVCRYELPTDDPDYEHRKVERASRTN